MLRNKTVLFNKKKKKNLKMLTRCSKKMAVHAHGKTKPFIFSEKRSFCTSHRTTLCSSIFSHGPRTFHFFTTIHLSYFTLNEVSQIIHRTSSLDNNYNNTTSTNLSSIFNTPDVFIVTIRSLLRESLYQLP